MVERRIRGEAEGCNVACNFALLKCESRGSSCLPFLSGPRWHLVLYNYTLILKCGPRIICIPSLCADDAGLPGGLLRSGIHNITLAWCSLTQHIENNYCSPRSFLFAFANLSPLLLTGACGSLVAGLHALCTHARCGEIQRHCGSTQSYKYTYVSHFNALPRDPSSDPH